MFINNNIMNKKDSWLEQLVENYKIPTIDKTKKSKLLTDKQLKIIKDGKK